MRPSDPVGLTLDTGALLAMDQVKHRRLVRDWLDRVLKHGGSICIPTGVVAQAWRSAQQVHLARLLKSEGIEFGVMTADTARLVGRLCASSGHADVVDVHVALCAQQRNHAVMTSDPDDIKRVDPSLPLIRI